MERMLLLEKRRAVRRSGKDVNKAEEKRHVQHSSWSTPLQRRGRRLLPAKTREGEDKTGKGRLRG